MSRVHKPAIITVTATHLLFVTAPAWAQPAPSESPEISGTDVGLAAGPGLLAPGVASFHQGDVAEGAFHLYVGLQAAGFFAPALADLTGEDEWDGPRRGVALATAAALFAVNYLSSISNARGRRQATGTPFDAFKLRVGVSVVAGRRADELDYRYEGVASAGQHVSVGIMLGPVVELAVTAESLYGDFDSEDDYGISVGGQITAYIPTQSVLRPYLGFGGAYHPDSPLLGLRSGFAFTLSSSIDVFVGARADFATANGFGLARAMGQFGFSQAF